MAIYDDEKFFKNYFELRENPNNYNDNFEQPAMMALIGDCSGLNVLDVGCGYGNACVNAINNGACNVVGIDVSEKMIGYAIKNNSKNGITYQVMNANDVDKLNQKFDLIISSLAFHYIEDFNSLMKKLYSILNPNGRLVFSMEHPIFTATLGNIDLWVRDENNNKIAYVLDNYSQEGVRNIEWLDKKITKYHRTTESIVSAIIGNGFTLEKLLEPTPTEETIKRINNMAQELHRPPYLLISARKK